MGFGLANIAGVGVRGFLFHGNGFPEGLCPAWKVDYWPQVNGS